MKNSDIGRILKNYTAGEADLKAANTALAEAGAGFRLEPGRNDLTEENRRATTVGYYPEQANGWGLLDTGTGSMEKVKVTGGRLESPANQIQPDGSVNMRVFVLIAGKRYEVLGDRLAEVLPDKAAPSVKKIPETPDLRRRIDLAGQVARQHTRAGDFDIRYDGLGYAVKSSRVNWKPAEDQGGDE